VYEDTYTWAFVQDFDGVAVEDGDTGGGVVGSKTIVGMSTVASSRNCVLRGTMAVAR
jgi:hypothetical protein